MLYQKTLNILSSACSTYYYFLSFQVTLSLVHLALKWIPQRSSLYCSNCSTFDWLSSFYHFSENIDDSPQNELLFSGHILTLNKITLTALLPHTRLTSPAAHFRLATGQRMLELESGRQRFLALVVHLLCEWFRGDDSTLCYAISHHTFVILPIKWKQAWELTLHCFYLLHFCFALL